jgi:hypothetical protein
MPFSTSQYFSQQKARFRTWHSSARNHFSAPGSTQVQGPTLPRYMREALSLLGDLVYLLKYAVVTIEKAGVYSEQPSTDESPTTDDRPEDNPYLQDLSLITSDITQTISLLMKGSCVSPNELRYHSIRDPVKFSSTTPESNVNNDEESQSDKKDWNERFLPDCGINREVILVDSVYYLGADAVVRLGYCEVCCYGASCQSYNYHRCTILTSTY